MDDIRAINNSTKCLPMNYSIRKDSYFLFFYFGRTTRYSLLEFRLDWPETIYTLPQQSREFFEFFAKVEYHDCKSKYDRFKEKTNRWY